MDTFDTPGPVSVVIDLYLGDVTVTAEDRADTVVTVEPANAANESDVEAAAQTRVDFADGVVSVKGPRLLSYVSWSNKSRAVAVTVAVPTGSSVAASSSMVTLRATGKLGRCEVKSGMGEIRLEDADTVKLKTFGDITVDTVDGDATVNTGTGTIRLGRVGGALTTKSAGGLTTVGEVGGSARLRSANGDITVDHADGDVDAVTAVGSVRVGGLRGGVAELKTATGNIDIGVQDGTAAWLDAHTGFGAVRNELADAHTPGPDDPTVKVRARTSYGDIVIRRS